MGKITVVCPNCRTRLSFKDIPGYQNMVIECPHCHFKAVASSYTPGSNSKSTNDDDGATCLYGGNVVPPTVKDLGQIRIVQSGQICPLKEGTNIIGRDAQSGTADIKVTKDPYMSRQHARIDVIDSGTQGMEYRLYEINSTNVIKLNGREISRGDIILLHFGDVMTMGKSDIRFEASSDEATQLMI